ncbi:hypothetical protein MJO28_011013 [Puccinia striiformis f. sp. tritici]|uniref:Uncharacterized protein n=2 Tax=Puccinia striiformis TaxID=27350 RepID=A0A2S4V9Q4_9BASI|nr:hypothetical protein MJO28_011013 [Puccinia striiformis f. sp. tritici]KAI7946233.1 hypothetical protein MJO29_010760 [Puccinia striiformis f. sp. tritici]POW06205.1 hypothetical protein PSTT_09103 [Puccinia striiformis]
MANQTMNSSYLSGIIHNAPAGTNPYSSAVLALQKLEKPISYNIFRYVLALYGSIYAVVCLCCVGILITPFFQGKVGGAKHNWIVKRRYMVEHSTPYLIVNNGLMIGISYLIAGVLFQCYITQQFNTMDTDRQSFLVSWLDMFKLPGACATYIQAFTMLFISASNPSTGGTRKYFMSPAVFNFLLIGLPVLYSIVAIGLIAHKAILIQKSTISYEILITMLTDVAHLWDGGKKIPTDSQQGLLQAAFEIFMEDSSLKSRSAIRIGMLWAFADVPSILIYIGGVYALVTTAHHPFKRFRRESAEALTKAPRPGMFEKSPVKLDTEESRPLARSLSNYFSLYFGDSSIFLPVPLLTSELHIPFRISVAPLLGDVRGACLGPRSCTRLAPIFFIINLGTSGSTLLAIIILLARIVGDGKEPKNAADDENSEYRSGAYSEPKLVFDTEWSMETPKGGFERKD